ncbi:M56 family metallopeptidase [uncultured Dokdonia sp.]|uniref:M56 family metallopeptidase n=1 Tax=uncultured Dokdonia sp. TaxID=575653 RepID=UPI00260F7228|nr:M56 family metallopeptidase [uncultured Dokdonia sp.]
MIEIICFQAIFLIGYKVFLKKETFFTYNRMYLLITPLLAIVLPFLKIAELQRMIPVQEVATVLPEVILESYATTAIDIVNPMGVVISNTPNGYVFDWIHIYYIGILISILLFGYKIVQFTHLFRFKEKGKRIIIVPDSTVAFTFFNYVFLGEKLSPLSRKRILAHEYIHIKQRHTLDLLFFEVLRIVFWFNPLVYIYQKEITLVHEYLADGHAVANTSKKQYYEELLNTVFDTKQMSFINPFFNHSIIKKRIIMLQKTKSKKIAKAKYLFLVPALFSILVYTACTDAQAGGTGYSSSDSEIIKNIEVLKNSIAKQGGLTEEEERALKVLTAVTANDKDILKDSTYDEVLNDLDIPFGVIEKVPTFPECSGTLKEIKKCTSQKIKIHANKGFNAKLPEELGLTGIKRVVAVFKIDTAGNIVDVRARGAHPKLEKEAIRVIKTLPQMIPGEHNGKKVSVLYELPFTFNL